MRRTIATLIAPLAVLVPAAPAAAHHPERDGLDPMQALSAHHQHGGNDGHLPPVQRGVDLVGKLDLFSGEEQPGRVSDVAAHGGYAYLGAFSEPDCEEGGVYVVDIRDPANPREAGFIPTSPFTYVGEGVQVLSMSTSEFTGQVLIHNNENCIPADGAIPGGAGGASLWDVTDPTDPQPLARHVGDTDPAMSGSIPHTSVPHQSHSAFGWQQGDKAYLVMVDNAELGATDIDILDITDPRDPELILETGLDDFPEILERPSPNGSNAFLHDMVVKRVGDRQLLLGSYWDGGYIVLDVTDLPEKPELLGHTDFGATEPFAAEMGLPADWTPEGNAHQAELNHDNTLFLGADEDFGARRVVGRITAGRHAGDVFSATQGSNVPQVTEDTPVTGPVDHVGSACTPLPPVSPDAHRVALAERGTCTFTVKTQNIQAAGYQAGIVFNDRATDADCDAHVYMLAVGDIPFVFVGRSAGLKLLDVEFEDPCETPTPAGAAGQAVDMSAVFDGWGYLHLYDAETMEVLDHWALPESLAPGNAEGRGDLSIHEVAMDPTANRAYVSHYAGGFRVLEFSRTGGIQEVGAYIAPGGSNLWGVEWHALPDGSPPIVLASDRDSGLWVFRPSSPPAGGGTAPQPGGGPSATQGTTPGEQPGAERAPRARGVRFGFRRTLRLTRRGVVRVPLRCPAAEQDGCEGVVDLRRGRRVLAKRSYRLAAGADSVLRLRLGRRERASLRRAARPRLVVRAVDREGPRARRRAAVSARPRSGR